MFGSKTWLIIVLIVAASMISVVIVRTLLFNPPTLFAADQSADSQSINIDKSSVAKNLSKALTFQTIATDDDNKQHAKSFEAFHQFLQQTYPSVFKQLSLKNIPPYGLLLHWKGIDSKLKPVLLMAHQDVVPIAPNTTSQWDHPPFSGAIDDEFVWGRGAIDDKSSLIALLEATEMLLKNDFKPKQDIYFFFGDNEEIGGPTAARAAEYFKQNNIHFDYVLDEGGSILEGVIPNIKQPVALISIAEKGYANITLTANTQGGHSSMPNKETAIGLVSQAIDRLEKNQMRPRFGELQQEIIDNIGPYTDFVTRMKLANLWLFKPMLLRVMQRNPFGNALVRTTTAPTIFNAGVKENVLPAMASAVVNFRIIPGDTTQSVIDHVRKTIKDDRVKVSASHEWNPSRVSSIDTPTYHKLVNTIHQVTSPEMIISPFLIVGATDARHFIGVSDNQYRFVCYPMTKSDMHRFHGTNERLSISGFTDMIRFYYLFMST